MNLTRKVVATLGTLTLAASGVLLTAPAAQANARDCLDYLQSQGYSLNYVRIGACHYAEEGDWSQCYYQLVWNGDVYFLHAERACDLGAA
ncbi:hypothetical protein AB0L74_29135 [Streptomyces sp. NPDC052020]|uniref:hypothetical protein n=1 Tax=Streptomyces sp. NPDC052020 TaxID=3155677 RepID=UPI003423494B